MVKVFESKPLCLCYTSFNKYANEKVRFDEGVEVHSMTLNNALIDEVGYLCFTIYWTIRT